MATQDDVWKHTASTLGTLQDSTLKKKVTQEKADAYDSLCHQFNCMANNFRLHLEGTPAHSWNKAAMKVFVASFWTKYPHYAANKAGDHFKVHVDTLIQKYRTQQATKDNPNTKVEANKKNQKNTRKATIGALFFDNAKSD